MASHPDSKNTSTKKRKFFKGGPRHSHPQKRLKSHASKARKEEDAPRLKRVVALNDLKWTPVDPPEMLDDSQGFFGIEEVHGVEVVRNGDTIQFVAQDIVSGDDEEEFKGFDDPPAVSGRDSTVHAEKATVNAKTDKGAKKEKRLEKAKNTAQKDSKDNRKKPSAINADADAELIKGADFSTLAVLGDDVDVDGEDGADVSAWAPLNLSLPLLSCLAKLAFSKPTAIQAAAIPPILVGHDVVGKASTGSGKTLAFSIPVVERWLAREQSGSATAESSPKQARPPRPLALILSPTRELAHQITKHIKALCDALPTAPYVCSVTGGLSVYKQQRQLEKADIVVATPGRLWEVLGNSKDLLGAFRSISFLVIDEADRLLSEGHFKEVEEILLALDRVETTDAPSEEDVEGGVEGGVKDSMEEDGAAGSSGSRQTPRQTLVFSATFNRELQQKLAGKVRYHVADETQSMARLLKKLNFREETPTFIDVSPVSQMAERLREGLVECGAMEKDLYLYALLLLLPPHRRTLVFTNSIGSVRRLTPMLQNLNLPALPLHAQMPQKARLRSVERFTAGQTRGNSHSDRGSVLLATDVAARGLDIPGIDVVVHYHVPRTADNYVHRSGRTARADRGGLSVLLCAPEEVVPTRRLVAKIHASAEAKQGTAPAKSITGFFIHSINLDRRLVSRLRERLVLAKQLADTALAKEKGSKDDHWMREAAEDLGVEYDTDDVAAVGGVGSWSGKGSGRRSRQQEARGLSKAETTALRAQLRQLLAKRINAGVSERYLTAGGVDVDALLRGVEGDFLGQVDGLGLE